jgi:hypothetical protein
VGTERDWIRRDLDLLRELLVAAQQEEKPILARAIQAIGREREAQLKQLEDDLHHTQ